MNFHVRTMTVDDLTAADKLRDAAGWNQLPSDWHRLLAHQPSGCFVAIQGNEIIGTVTTTCYGRELAWIGMMLVRPDCQRRGIGQSLMNAAVEYLRSESIQCIMLDATPAGQPLYEKLGFSVDWSFHRWQSEGEDVGRSLDSDQSCEFAEARGCDGTDAVVVHSALDCAAFGVDRQDWLTRLAADSSCVTSEDGYGMSRRGAVANYIGPVVAGSAAAARQLVGQILQSLDGPVFWDVPEHNPQATVLASESGFRKLRALHRMRLGDHAIDADTALQFAISDPATG
jgi:predicted N-acetyltransferase YhbS